MKGLYFVMPVWGERYVARWLRYGLPSILSAGNLPALAKICPVKILLFSTAEDLQTLLASPLIKAARDLGGVRAMPIANTASELAAGTRKDVVYGHMTVCHNRGLAQAWKDDHGLIFGVADAVYADGSLAEVGRHIAAGKRAALAQSPSVREDLFADALERADGALRTDLTLTIPPRSLIKVAVQTLGPLSESEIWDASHFTTHPSILYWRLGTHGFLMRAWHLYPMFLYPEREAKITTTVDGDLIGQALTSLDSCAYLDDSDRYLFVDVADPNKRDFVPRVPHRANPREVATWLPANTRPFNRELIRHKFWLHDGIDRADWRHVEAESDRAIEEALEFYNRMAPAAEELGRGAKNPVMWG